MATRKVKVKLVTLLVNGQVTGKTFPNTASLKAAVLYAAQEHGIKGATLKVNGARIARPELDKTLAAYRARTVEFISKETRG